MRVRLRHLRIGLAYGYPLCCVLRYSCSRHLGGGQARRRGIRYVRDGSAPYVPCLVLHRPYRSWVAHTRLHTLLRR